MTEPEERQKHPAIPQLKYMILTMGICLAIAASAIAVFSMHPIIIAPVAVVAVLGMLWAAIR